MKKLQEQHEEVLVTPQKKTTELQSFFISDQKTRELISKSKTVVITGLDGGGKTSTAYFILKIAKESSLDLPLGLFKAKKLVTTTTRAPRASDRPGEYEYVSTREFDTIAQSGGMIEFQEVRHGSFYGVKRSELFDFKQSTALKIICVDYLGAKKFASVPGVPVFFISPSDPEVALTRRIKEVIEKGGKLLKKDIMARREANKRAWEHRDHHGFTFIPNDVPVEKTAFEVLRLTRKFATQHWRY